MVMVPAGMIGPNDHGGKGSRERCLTRTWESYQYHVEL